MEQTKALNALEPFLALSKSATSPRAASDLVVQATSAPNTYVFAELLQTPNIQNLRSSEEYASYLTLLEIFAWGTWEDYKGMPDASLYCVDKMVSWPLMPQYSEYKPPQALRTPTSEASPAFPPSAVSRTLYPDLQSPIIRSRSTYNTCTGRARDHGHLRRPHHRNSRSCTLARLRYVDRPASRPCTWITTRFTEYITVMVTALRCCTR